MTRKEFQDLFQTGFPLLGMVHLQPLPGAPRFGGNFNEVVEQALVEADLLARSGFHGVVLENFNDVPFYPDRVPADTIAAMAIAAREVVKAVSVPVGVNVLRNDAQAALAVAAAAGAAFIRVNVLTGVMVADQGLIQGRAHELMRSRREVATTVAVFADVLVKHAQPLGALSISQAAEEAVERGLADALIVSGAGTGKPADLQEAQAVRTAVPETPVLIGSGVTAATVGECRAAADGVIVGSDLKNGGRAGAPLDPARVTRFVELASRSV
jgi:membrane complex biogenesis BtpA family protein